MKYRPGISIAAVVLLAGAAGFWFLTRSSQSAHIPRDQASSSESALIKLPTGTSTTKLPTRQIISDNVKDERPRNEMQDTTVLESEIDAEIQTLGGFENLTSAQEIRMRATLRNRIQKRKEGKVEHIMSDREFATRPQVRRDALVPDSVLNSFVTERNTPGAYVAAAGASRDVAWIEKGLARFPNDPTLLRAKALMDFQYLKNPELVKAWQQADPGSGWPGVLQADIALGLKQPQKAYDAIQDAVTKRIEFNTPPEIRELISTTGSQPNSGHFRDIGRDGSWITNRMAGEFMTEAKSSDSNSTDSGWEYYAGAALALYDLQAESSYSETANSAAASAKEALELLGVGNAARFLRGQTYEEVQQHYREIIARSKAAQEEALIYGRTLTEAAKAKFEAIRNEFGSARALEMTRGAAN